MPPDHDETLTPLSVVISNFNGAKYLPRLIETLRAQRGVTLQIIVVDRNSTDDSPAILAAYPDIEVVRDPPEHGLVTGYAVGAERARHDLLFFCNEDMWFDPDCLRRLADQIDLEAHVAAADPWQWTYDGQVWIHGGTRFRPARLDLNCPYPLRRYDFACPLATGDVVPFGCAGALVIHRAVYVALGGWSRDFFLDHEDVDFFIRAWQAGWKCVTVPDAKVYHAVNASNSKAIGGGRVPVGRRRYISGRSSLPILGVKYFSAGYAFVPALICMGVSLYHVVCLHPKRAWWSVKVGCEFLKRLLPACAYRRRHLDALRKRPGEQFFLDPMFQA